MDENDDTQRVIDEGIELGKAAKEKLASDPDAVRKIAANQLANTVTETVTVYPDKRANKAFADYSAKFQDIAGRIPKRLYEESDEDYAERTKEFKAELEALEAEGEPIRQAVRDSGVTFEFVGIGKRALKRIKKQVTESYPLPQPGERDEFGEERQDEYEHRVIAAHLAQAGYTADDIADFHDAWPNKAYADLWAAALKLSIADDYLRGAVDADF